MTLLIEEMTYDDALKLLAENPDWKIKQLENRFVLTKPSKRGYGNDVVSIGEIPKAGRDAFKSALVFAKTRSGSVVRRLGDEGYGVFDRSGLRIITFRDEPAVCEEWVGELRLQRGSEEDRVEQNDNTAPGQSTVESRQTSSGPLAGLARLDNFSLIEKEWEQVHNTIDRIVNLIRQAGEAPVEAYITAKGEKFSGSLSFMLETFRFQPEDSAVPLVEFVKLIKLLKSIEIDHMEQAVYWLKERPNAQFIPYVDDLTQLIRRVGVDCLKDWCEFDLKVEKIYELIGSYGNRVVDQAFLRVSDIPLDLPLTVVIGSLKKESIGSARRLSPDLAKFVRYHKNIDLSLLSKCSETIRGNHESNLEQIRLLRQSPLVQFFFLDNQRLSESHCVSLVPRKRSNLADLLDRICSTEDQLDDLGHEKEWIEKINWLKKEIDEQSGYLLDPSDSAGTRYLEYLSKKGIKVERASEVAILRLFDWTLQRIGDYKGVTQERIRQMENQALTRRGPRDDGELLTRFSSLKKERKRVLLRNAERAKRAAILELLEREGPLSKEEIQERFDSEKLDFGRLFSPEERSRFLPTKRPDSYLLWTDDQILDAIRSAATMAFPLTHGEYTMLLSGKYVEGPSVPTIIARFRSWRLACERAGVESGKTNRTLGSGSRFHEQDLVDAINRYVASGRKLTYADYEDWARENQAPSGATMRSKLGLSWRELLEFGLRNNQDPSNKG